MADMLSFTSDLPVLDRTGLTGKFAYEMRGAATGRGMTGALIDALEEQLGLTVNNRRGPIEVLVVEAIERPEEN